MADASNYPRDTKESSHERAKTRVKRRSPGYQREANFDGRPWTTDEIAELARLAAVVPQIPYSQIATYLPGRTKNSVIGQVRRMRMPSRRASPKLGRPKKERRPGNIAPERRIERLIASPHDRRAARPSLWTGQAAPPPQTGTITFLELTPTMCHWQFEQGTYCAAGVVPTFRYCLGHARIIYKRGN